MSESINLTDKEIIDITDRVRGFAQAKVLRDMGIPHKLRADGIVKVSRSAYEQAMGLNTDNKKKVKKEQTEPNFETFINAAKAKA